MIAKLSPIALMLFVAGCSSPDVLAQDSASGTKQSNVTTVTSTDGRTGTSASTSTSSTDGTGTSVSTSVQSGTGSSSSSSSSTSSSNGAMSTAEETDDYEFDYSWPSAAGRDPALAKILQGRLEKARAEVISQSAEARAESTNNDFPFRKHSLGETWEVVADTPAFLSLSSAISTYGGGAHGNFGFDSLLWDKKNSQIFAATDLFVSPAALEAALKPRYCSMLNKKRADRRGAPVEKGSSDTFDACPQIKQINVLLGSSGGKTFDRIGLRFAPYVAGPYAEGTYELTLPVDAAAMKAVDPTYRSAFSVGS